MPLYPALRILNTEPHRFSNEAKAAMHALGAVDDIESDRAFLLQSIQNYDVLFIGLRNVIDAEILSRATRLKVIVSPTTGHNHMDMDYCKVNGITVLSLRGETAFLKNVTATAELTWGLLLALYRKIPAAMKSVVAGEWDRDRFYGRELKNKTLGVVGCGRLGRMLCKYGHVFRMNVLAHDTNDTIESPGTTFVGIDELLLTADVVAILLPYNEETHGYMNAERIAKMKRGAVLLNAARGEIIDEEALLSALESGRLAGAGLDVLDRETSMDPAWLSDKPLLRYAQTHDNLIMTPHIGGATYDSAMETNMFMIEKMGRYLKDGESR